jgi:transposase
MPSRSVRLRALTRGEQRQLERRLRDLSLSARIHQRYRVIAEVRAGRPVAEAAERAGCHFTRAYAWVRRFNQSGFATFELATNPHGRPPILRSEQLRELVEVALSSPQERGLPYTAWSVAKLAAYCRKRKILPEISDEWVRRLLRREGLSAQRVKTWKTSSDPRFDEKRGPPAGSMPSARRGRG